MHNAKGSLSRRDVPIMADVDENPDQGANQPGGSEQVRPAADAAFAMHEHIGRQLKAMFDEVAAQPIPPKLAELLEELERKQAKP